MIIKNTSLFLERLYLVFLNYEIKRIPYIRSRGLRSMNFRRCILLISCVISILILIYIHSIIQKYNAYQKFVEIHPFSTVPFWKDKRRINEKTLLPVFKIDDIHLSNATIAIAACCRNVRKHLKGFQRNVAAITALFGQYRIYLCESDSYDNTLRLLNEWQKNDSDHVRVHSEGAQSEYISSRKFNLNIIFSFNPLFNNRSNQY